MTLKEVLVVVLVLTVLVVMVILHVNNEESWRRKAALINCVNNLKQIGLAYRIWEGEHGDKFPAQISVTNGGAMELVASGNNAWLNFLVMSNELSTPKILLCRQKSIGTRSGFK